MTEQNKIELLHLLIERIAELVRWIDTHGIRQPLQLPRTQLSGLIDAERVLKRVKGIAITRLTSADVVRHPLVARIIDAYDKQPSPDLSAATVDAIDSIAGHARTSRVRRKNVS